MLMERAVCGCGFATFSSYVFITDSEGTAASMEKDFRGRKSEDLRFCGISNCVTSSNSY